jgi:plasmid stabilization system protein ParE
VDESPRESERIIEITEAAQYDLAGIDNATAAMWGEAQAERYIAYLRETVAYLVDDPTLGYPIDQRPGYYVYTAKYSKRRAAKGHRIFYRQIENGIRIIRILHTSMNWPDHLP